MKQKDKNRHERRAEQLGMNWGTANARLRKMIIFSLIGQTEQDKCYQCGEKIISVDDMSIEHINPWENRDVSLFWDINNIAFSHVGCNKPHATKAPRKVEGYDLWCAKCKTFKDEESFARRSDRTSGRHSYCRECERTRKR